MKTAKIKIKLSLENQSRVDAYREELRWCWNRVRVYALRHQCLDWYKWAEKQSDGSKLYPAFSLDGIIPVPLHFSKAGAWNFAACQIAVGGPYWAKDAPNTIAYKSAGKIKYKHSVKLVESDRPYERIPIQPYELPNSKFKGLLNITMAMLNADRRKELLPELTLHSKYLYGMVADFATAWAAYCDPKLGDRGQPLFKDGKKRKITSLYSRYPPIIDLSRDRIFIDAIGPSIECIPCDRTWKDRIDGLEPRSFRLVEEPSGLYLCVTLATTAEAQLPTLKAAQKEIAIALKKENPGATKEEMALVRQDSELYRAAAEAILQCQAEASQLSYEMSSARNNAKQIIRVTPGLRRIATTERLQFLPNRGRLRVDQHIAELQQRLDIVRNSNDRKLAASWKLGQREPTQNEARLMRQLARLNERARNSTRNFNQKLSTRLARMGRELVWDILPVDEMLWTPDPILDVEGEFWHPNGAERKRIMNRALKNAAIGQLQQLTEDKMVVAQKVFVAKERK